MATTQLMKPRKNADLIAAVVSVGITLAVGVIGALATASNVTTWYAGLNKPAFSPPNAVFAPVWTTLYIVMALAAWRVWRSGQSGRRVGAPLVLYAVQLGLNLAWSLIFFGMHQPGFALVDIGLLLATIIITAAAFWRVDRPAGAMMVPYIAWVAFASLLNFEIWKLN